jgi:signal transduction histidine kinase
MITGLRPRAGARAATMVQVRSLTYRNRFTEAIGLSLRSLRDCGITVPAEGRLLGEIDDAFETVYRWLQDGKAVDDLARPDIRDPALIAAGQLMNAMMPAVYLNGDHVLLGWLSLEALRVWIKHGPARTLIGPAFHFAHAAIELRRNYAAGYHALRRLLTVSQARGYEPDTSQALNIFAHSARFWFEPIENGVLEVQRARAGLIAAGDLHNAGYTFAAATTGLLESARSLDICGAEVKTGLAFVRRTGGEQIAQWLESYGWLIDTLRGASSDDADEMAPDEKYADNPLARFYAHINRAVAAAIFGDPGDLERYTSAAMGLLGAVSGHYETAWARLLRGLAVAGQARDAEDREERRRLLSELEDVTRWLAARAADAPDNFRHLVLLLEAERAWTNGDFRAASLAFDAARREVMRRQRPWHRAVITERAARFVLAYGLGHLGEELLTQARQQYLAWGAIAKVDQLDWAYPILRDQPDTSTGDDAGRAELTEHRLSVTTGTIDLLGILSASRALSSETSVERLRARVIEVLGAMTGATGVHLLVWSEDRQAWLVPASDGTTVAVVGTEHDGVVPMTVLRYVERVREPLVVSDATTDDRFARDRYFDGLDLCSLLSVPIFSRGTLQAVLLLENRLIRGAFSAARLDAVKLITSQLAVSLDNAYLYAELRLAEAATRHTMSDLMHVDRMTTAAELSASIAHEVSQPLAAMVSNANAGTRWLTAANVEEAKASFKRIADAGQHASEIIASVRALFKKETEARTHIDLNQLIRNALSLEKGPIETHRVLVRLELNEQAPKIFGDRVQLLQVILNLIRNAIDAIGSNELRVLHLRSQVDDSGDVLISVEDSGTGITKENIDHIFEPLFTTKSKGLGIGLSICRSIIEGHDGSLWVTSTVGHGSTFFIKLPRFKAGDGWELSRSQS